MSRVKVPTRVTVAQVQAAPAALGITSNDLHRLELEGFHGTAVHVLRTPTGGLEAAASIPRQPTKHRHTGAHGWTDGPTCKDCT